QPFEFAMKNLWDAGAFSILKYLARYRRKGGTEDLFKARHFVELRQAMLADLPAPPFIEISMSWFLARNEVARADWPALLCLEELVQTPADLKQQCPDGLCFVHEVVSTQLKSLIGDLIAQHELALAAP